MLFDDNKFVELDENMSSGDPLDFVDTKKYPDRIVATQKKTGLKDALRSAHGKINGIDITIACMDFAFIYGRNSVISIIFTIWYFKIIRIFPRLFLFKFPKKV